MLSTARILRLFVSFCLILGSANSHGLGKSIYTLDASGTPGVDAEHGTPDYTNETAGGTEGRRGRSGGNASEAVAGGHASDVSLSIAHGRTQAEIVIEGVTIDNPGRQSRRVGPEGVVIGDSGYIYTLANGGRAGEGGIGGGGEKGGKGAKGSNANAQFYIAAGDGDPGGPGGKPGKGTSASAAGNGGKIEVTIPVAHSHLALLVKPQIRGGEGASAGKHGVPGKGGTGGDGGDGDTYRWKTKDAYTKDGRHYPAEYDTRKQSPGSKGPKGNDAEPITEELYDAEPGKNGSFKFTLVDEKGVKAHYPSAFDLIVTEFEHRPQDQGVPFYEPGRNGIAQNVVVKNAGGMPTPEAPAYISLVYQGWVVSDPIKVKVPALQPGQSATIKGPFTFKVKDIDQTWGETEDPKTGPRFEENGPIRYQIFQTIAERYFENVDYMETMNVTFPVEIGKISLLRSMRPGEMAEVSFEVRNITDRHFGKESDWGREVQTGISASAKDVDANDLIEFYTLDGKKAEIRDELIRAVTHLGPKGSVDKDGHPLDRTLVKGIVHLKPAADAYDYTGINILTRLFFNDGKDTIMKMRQAEIDTIRVSESFTVAEDGGDWLLVTNNETTPEEKASWTKLAESMGKKLSIWDLGLHGYLDLTQAIKKDQSLAHYFQEGLVIMLNDSFDPGVGNTRSEYMLAQKSFVEAAAAKGLNILVVGNTAGGASETLGRFAFPFSNIEDEKYKSPEEFLKAMIKEADRKEMGLGDSPARKWLYPLSQIWDVMFDWQLKLFVDAYDQVEVSDTYIFSRPKAEELKRIAAGLLVDHSRIDPDFTMYAITAFEPQRLRGPFSWWKWNAFSRWSLGRIEVRRGLDFTSGQATALEVPKSRFKDDSYILGIDNIKALFFTERFETNLATLRNAMMNLIWIDLPASERDARVNALVDVMLNKLAMEQVRLRNSFFKGNLNRQKVEEKIPKLRLLSKELKALDIELVANIPMKDPAVYAGLMKLLAGLHLFERAEVSVWDWFIIVPTKNRLVSDVSQGYREGMYKFLFGDDKAHIEKYKATYGALKQRAKVEKKKESRAYRESVRRIAMPVTTDKEFFGGIESLIDVDGRIVTREQFDQRLKREAEATKQQQAYRGKVETHRQNMLLTPDECRDIMLGKSINR